MPDNKDLYLKYKFTDRGGSHVFDIYYMPAGIDIMQRPDDIVGEVRMEPDWEDAVTVPAPPPAANDADALYCDDCGSEFQMGENTFVGNWDDPDSDECSPFMELTQLCEPCLLKRDQA